MADPIRPDHPTDTSAAQVEAVMRAARTLVAITARSMAALADTVTLPQFRVMVMVHSQDRLNLAAIARGLGVHPSNATRACDRLVDAGLLRRQDNPADRRNLLLELTDRGRDVVEQVMEHRRAAIAEILAELPARRRAALADALTAFADVADQTQDIDAWALDWITSATTVSEATHSP